MSFLQMLRAATVADHDMVDARFGGFALDDVADYRRFLRAHGRALPAAEAVLAADQALPNWRRRTALLREDLAALGEAMPKQLPFAGDGAARWGILYVIEGSRLGGQLLARNVPAGLPAAYLAARHVSGEWRGLLDAIETRAAAEDGAWHTAVVAGARATFALYARAADDRRDF